MENIFREWSTWNENISSKNTIRNHCDKCFSKVSTWVWLIWPSNQSLSNHSLSHPSWYYNIPIFKIKTCLFQPLNSSISSCAITWIFVTWGLSTLHSYEHIFLELVTKNVSKHVKKITLPRELTAWLVPFLRLAWLVPIARIKTSNYFFTTAMVLRSPSHLLHFTLS